MQRSSWLVVLLLMAAPSWAGGPRFVTGTQYPQAGLMMAFYTPQVTYATDPGGLSVYASHAQADAMVAAAAAVWNVPTANLTLGQSGQLAEHVNGSNAFFNGTEIVFPLDAQATNYLNIPIAVIYDADGSVTDLLLGSGASSPSGCRQNGVTESVDGFGATGTIQHALIVLNGRCVTSAPQSLLQMQYQTMRAFGRVLGLAWSQLNDNVFTGATQPTAQQMAHWPVMHPIDVVCGPYTYLCVQNPFVLRDDDISTLALLYPVTAANVSPGKEVSSTGAAFVEGWTYFSTGQGMDLLNMTVTLSQEGGWQGWQEASGITGQLFQIDAGNPVSGATPLLLNSGVEWNIWSEYYAMGRVPIAPPFTGLYVVPEAINPLYTGSYALGPYVRTPMSLSTGAPAQISSFAQPGVQQAFWTPMTNEPGTCDPGSDGTELLPVAADPSGWSMGLLCGMGHSSWLSMTVQPGRTWTIETTALDERGDATVQKAQPVIGVWAASDPTGTLPTVASQPVAMNAMALGVTQLRMAAAPTGANATYRLVIADQYGEGRPDFGYQARVLYADSVSPALLGAAGGTITLTGMGFRLGNEVLVNGVPAKVTSWTATKIVAVAPTQSVAQAGAVAVDVEVLDTTTGGSSDIGGALTYAATAIVVGPPATISVVSGAGQSVTVGTDVSAVVLQVSDAVGNAVSGATVMVYQTDYAWQGVCTAVGPCAAAPVLKTQQVTMTADANGQVSVAPMVVPGQPQLVEIAAASGATGFVSVGVVVRP
jgi:hypothetical protein